MSHSKVAQRRESKIASIVEAAWGLAREHGIQLVSLRDLAKEVGMQQPSLYAYFDSKNALYDAMFADGNRQLLEVLVRDRSACRPAGGAQGLPGRLRRLRRRGPGTQLPALPSGDPGLRAEC